MAENRTEDAAEVHSAASRTAIISVSYNSLHKLPHMLASVPDGASAIVVDNGSDDLDALRNLCDRHGATLIENDENLGFGRACNIGAEHTDAEFLLFLNPDAALTPDALDHLVSAADSYPESGGMNPSICFEDGTPFFKRRSHLMPKSEWLPRGQPSDDRELTVLSGAAFFVRRRHFESVGGFDPNIFLFHEDDDLALRLRKQIGPLRFVKKAVVYHEGGSSSPRNPGIGGIKAFHMGRSRVYAARKHGQPFAATKALVEAVFKLLTLQFLFSQRARAKHVNFFKGVVSELTSPSGTK